MSKEAIITAIDVGTNKCTTMIGSVNPETRQLRLIGMSAVPSRGVRKSVIVDLEAALGSIEQSLNAAERMAGLSVSSAYLSVSGNHVRSTNSKGVVAVAEPDKEITANDVSRVIEAARAVSVPSQREIIHVIPRYYQVDSQDGIRDPVGMTGVRLESEAHIITGMSTSIKNLEKSINDLGVTVDGFVFSALAASQVTLSETEKELGAIALDIGAGTSSFCVYVDGALVLSGSLPVGARHITQDIALGCQLSLESAQKIKLALATDDFITMKPRPGESKKEFNLRKAEAEQFDPAKLGIEEDTVNIKKSVLIKTIMVPRMKEIIQMLGEELSKHELLELVPAGLVISGGGAQTVGLVDVARQVMRLPCRIGYPSQIAGLVGEAKSPAYATAVGLLLYAKKQGAAVPQSTGLDLGQVFGELKLGGIVPKIVKIFKSLLP